MTSRTLVLVGLFALLYSVDLTASSIFNLIHDAAPEADAPVEIVLELPLDSIYAKTYNEQSAVLTFTDRTGLAQRWPLHVDVRGKFRRRICSFPPLKLNFSKKDLKAAGLEKFDKLKLVTPCFEDEEGQELILREYLAYRMFNKISPSSFRVQLLSITYRDSNGNHEDQTAYAFILEDTDEMAARLGGVELEDALGLSPTHFDRRAETTQAIFSYFIGNTDWNATASHNLKMVEMPDGRIIPVPYDFDFAAIVGAPYATPNNSVGQYALNQRVYLGFLATDSLLTSTLRLFEDRRKELLQTVRKFRILSLGARSEITSFLNSFYAEMDYVQRNADTETTLFTLLRGNQTEVVPPGADPTYYGVSRK